MALSPSEEKRAETIRRMKEEDEALDIRKIRARTGLTQKEFALKYHVSARSVEAWETNPECMSHKKCPASTKYLLNRIIDLELANYIGNQRQPSRNDGWAGDVVRYFVNDNCPAITIGKGYIKNGAINGNCADKVLEWIADRDHLESAYSYVIIHRTDADAEDLKQYYNSVISWAKRLFPITYRGATDCTEWGLLYNRYGKQRYSSEQVYTFRSELVDMFLYKRSVTRKAGIIEYLLSDRTETDAKLLKYSNE
jgi:DNA-binding transcriptional regulator YiaG